MTTPDYEDFAPHNPCNSWQNSVVLDFPTASKIEPTSARIPPGRVGAKHPERESFCNHLLTFRMLRPYLVSFLRLRLTHRRRLSGSQSFFTVIQGGRWLKNMDFI